MLTAVVKAHLIYCFFCAHTPPRCPASVFSGKIHLHMDLFLRGKREILVARNLQTQTYFPLQRTHIIKRGFNPLHISPLGTNLYSASVLSVHSSLARSKKKVLTLYEMFSSPCLKYLLLVISVNSQWANWRCDFTMYRSRTILFRYP